MTAQLELDRILDAFLGEGPTSCPDRVLDAALADITTTRQRRAWRVPRRYSDMPTPLRLLAAAAILAAAVGGVFVLGSSLRNDAPPTPETTRTSHCRALSARQASPWRSGGVGRSLGRRPTGAFGSPAGRTGSSWSSRCSWKVRTDGEFPMAPS